MCDLGSTNQTVLKELEIDSVSDGEKTFFQHQCDVAKKYMYLPTYRI